MDTQTQNARAIDYDNYPVIDMTKEGFPGWFRIIRPDGRNHNTYQDPEIARCDFRWYMERMMDNAFSCLRWA
jgi:hypothetical protein